MGITLGRKVEYVVRPGYFDGVLNRDVVSQVPVDEADPISTIQAIDVLLEIVERASPAGQPHQLPICVRK